MESKYITAASGEPILSWVTMYTITLSFNIHKYVVKEKVVIDKNNIILLSLSQSINQTFHLFKKYDITAGNSKNADETGPGCTVGAGN